MELVIKLDIGKEPDLDKKAIKWCTTFFYQAFKEKKGFEQIRDMIIDEKHS